MTIKNLEYFIELLGQGKEITGSFNLWAKQGNKYHNIATLFYNDPMCGCDWSFDKIGRAVSYSESEIQDELENPLRPISNEIGRALESMNVSFKDISEYLIKLCEENGNLAGIKYCRKSGGKENGR